MNPKPTFIHTKRDYKDNKLVIYHKLIYDIELDIGRVYLARFDCKCEEPMEIGIDLVGNSLDRRKEFKVATSVFVYPEIVNYKLLFEIPRFGGVGGSGGGSSGDVSSGGDVSSCKVMNKLVMFANKLFVVENLSVENSKERRPLERTVSMVGEELGKIGYELRRVILNERDIDVFDNNHYEIFLGG